MITLCIYVIAIIGIIAIIFILYDIIPRLIRHFERKQIGIFENENDWYLATKKIQKKWLKKLPIVKIKDQTRLVLLDKLLNQHSNSTIQSWQYSALLKSNDVDLDKDNPFYDIELIKWKTSPTNVDFGFLGYEILNKSSDKEQVYSTMLELKNNILNNMNKEGILLYRKNVSDIAFVDTIGLAIPFLFNFSFTYNDEECYKIAKKNIEFYYFNSKKDICNLPSHAIDIVNKYQLGSIGWGRGVGWFLLGLIDSYEYIINERDKNNLYDIIIEYANYLEDYLSKNDYFCCQMLFKSHYDSSINAIVGYYFAKLYKFTNNQKYFELSKKCLNIIIKNTRKNGKIDYSQGDTKGIGAYSQCFDIMPFTQGIAIKMYEILYGGSI